MTRYVDPSEIYTALRDHVLLFLSKNLDSFDSEQLDVLPPELLDELVGMVRRKDCWVQRWKKLITQTVEEVEDVGSMGGSFKPVIPELCLRGVDFGPPPQRKVRGRGLASQSYLWMATDGDQDRSPSPETRSGPRQHPRSHTISPLDTPFKQPITPSAFREMSVDMLVARQGGLVKELVLDQWTCSTLLGWIREEIEAEASTQLLSMLGAAGAHSLNPRVWHDKRDEFPFEAELEDMFECVNRMEPYLSVDIQVLLSDANFWDLPLVGNLFVSARLWCVLESSPRDCPDTVSSLRKELHELSLRRCNLLCDFLSTMVLLKAASVGIKECVTLSQSSEWKHIKHFCVSLELVLKALNGCESAQSRLVEQMPIPTDVDESFALEFSIFEFLGLGALVPGRRSIEMVEKEESLQACSEIDESSEAGEAGPSSSNSATLLKSSNPQVGRDPGQPISPTERVAIMEEPVVEEEGTFALEPLRFYAESLDLSCLRHVTKPIVDVSQMNCLRSLRCNFVEFQCLADLVQHVPDHCLEELHVVSSCIRIEPLPEKFSCLRILNVSLQHHLNLSVLKVMPRLETLIASRVPIQGTVDPAVDLQELVHLDISSSRVAKASLHSLLCLPSLSRVNVDDVSFFGSALQVFSGTVDPTEAENPEFPSVMTTIANRSKPLDVLCCMRAPFLMSRDTPELRKIQEAGTIVLKDHSNQRDVFEGIRFFSCSPSFLQYALRCLHDLLVREPERFILQNRVLRDFVNTDLIAPLMQAFRHDYVLTLSGRHLALMTCYFSVFETGLDKLVEAGAVEIAVEVIQEYCRSYAPQFEHTILNLLSFLNTLAHNKSYSYYLIKENIPLLIMDLMKRQLSGDIISACCSLIINLTWPTNQILDVIIDMNLIRCIKVSIQENQHSQAVLFNCVGVLRNLSCDCERGVAEAIREDILEQVFQIFKNHHDDAELVEACTSLVWNLSETACYRHVIAGEYGEGIVEIIKAYSRFRQLGSRYSMIVSLANLLSEERCQNRSFTFHARQVLRHFVETYNVNEDPVTCWGSYGPLFILLKTPIVEVKCATAWLMANRAMQDANPKRLIKEGVFQCLVPFLAQDADTSAVRVEDGIRSRELQWKTMHFLLLMCQQLVEDFPNHCIHSASILKSFAAGMLLSPMEDSRLVASRLLDTFGSWVAAV